VRTTLFNKASRRYSNCSDTVLKSTGSESFGHNNDRESRKFGKTYRKDV
jgi:hypothetical protein